MTALIVAACISATASLAGQTSEPESDLGQQQGNHWADLIASWQPENAEHEQIPRVVHAHTEGEKWVVELSSVVEGVDLAGLDPLVQQRLGSEELAELLRRDTPEERERKRRWLDDTFAKLTVRDRAEAYEALKRHRDRLTALFRACIVLDVSSEECAAELPRAQNAQAAMKGFEKRAGRPAIEDRWLTLHGRCLDGYEKDKCLEVAQHFMKKKAYEDAAVLYRRICSAAASRSQRGAACANLGMLHTGSWLGTPDASLARKYLKQACGYGNSQACKKLRPANK